MSPAARTGRPVDLPTLAVLGAVASVQVGAAFAKQLFGVVPPTSMTWLRLAWSALALVALRPLLAPRAAPTTGRRNWPVGLGYAACLVVMNWSIYQAFSRIPLGVAVTLEFLGPLAVAVAGARRARHLLWAALAAAGVVLLEWSPARLDPEGVVFALVAASCWAGYILLGSRAGRSWPGLDALTLACVLGAVVLAAPAVVAGGAAVWRPAVLATGLAVGLLSSVVPYGLELFALRSIAPRVFGVLMSLEPVAAALAALAVLGERLGMIDVVAMGCIVVASIGATRGARAV
ncbi:MAG TPA: EamA family transporter [Propionibacteriaceae bacterium]|nr:EamA family transporter [Propionibacteriaceae bacterium]